MFLQVECKKKDSNEPWKIAQKFSLNEFKSMEDAKTHDFSLLISVLAPTWQGDGSLELKLK